MYNRNVLQKLLKLETNISACACKKITSECFNLNL